MEGGEDAASSRGTVVKRGGAASRRGTVVKREGRGKQPRGGLFVLKEIGGEGIEGDGVEGTIVETKEFGG